MPKSLAPRPGGNVGRRRLRSGLPRDVAGRGAADDEAHRRSATRSSRLSRAIELLDRDDSGSRGRGGHEGEAVVAAVGVGPRGARDWRSTARSGGRRRSSELKAYRRFSGRADQNHVIADCLRALGRPREAVPLAEEELRAKVPNEAKAEAVIVAASALADQGRFAEALAFLGRARTSADVAEAYTLRLWYVRGDILARAGRREEAAAEFRKIMRHDAAAFDVAERLAELG